MENFKQIDKCKVKKFLEELEHDVYNRDEIPEVWK
jgi:hypothetical protein